MTRHKEPFMTKQLLFLGIIMCLQMASHAQSVRSDSVKNQKTGVGYIENLNDQISVKLDVNDNIEGYQISNQNKHLTLFPNTSISNRLTIHYRFISLSVDWIPSFIPGNADTQFKGRTTSNELTLNIHAGRVFQSLSLARTKGFYLENTGDYQTNWIEDKDPYILFPDLIYRGIRGQTTYKCNPQFSIKALTVQSERQLKSAGSFMPMLYYHYFFIDDRTPLTINNSTFKTKNLELLLSMSYLHTFVFHQSYYVSLGVIPGAGWMFTNNTIRYPDDTIRENQQNMIFRFKGRFAMGYNARCFFAGAYVIAATSSYVQNNASAIIGNDQISYQIFAGYRFNKPNAFKRFHL